MKQSVKSTDERKPIIMAELKKKSGGNRVTLVKQIGANEFTGHCQKGSRAGYQSLGDFTVRISFGVCPDTKTVVYTVLE